MEVLAGRYRLISPLGRGGMGQVWEGRDERLGRTVAVKLLTFDALAGRSEPDDGVRRFTREAAVTAGLGHPGVPAIYDAGEYDGGLYLVMELIEGCTVSDLIAEQGPLPAPWAAAIGAQVAAVLAVAHQRGVIHRDIKPANIMVTADGTAKILDFGVAGILGQRITSTGASMGTPAYMAPEQLSNLPATASTDLYALGCLLYEMLSGEPVFSATSPAALIRMHLEEPPAPLRRGDLDLPLVQLVWQLLQKDPAMRPSGAAEAYERLLPYGRSPGVLGDINPLGEGGVRMYVRALSGMYGGAGQAAPMVPAMAPAARAMAPAAGAMPPAARARRGVVWTAWHSLWALPTLLPFGITTWLAFTYIGVRDHRRSWLVTGGVYLALEATAWAVVLSSTDPAPLNSRITDIPPEPVQNTVAFIALFVIWLGGIIHALWVNVNQRLPLLAEPRR